MADFQTFNDNWLQRLGELQSQGIDVNHAIPVIRQDFSRLQRGEQTLTDTEAIAGIVSAATGKSVIQEPKKKTATLFDVLGNIPSDIGGILQGITRLPAGIYHEAQAIPQFIQHPPPLSWSTPGDVARSLAQVPIARWVPGVYTASNLTTPQGRQELLQHPVSTALDVLPAAGLAGRAGAAAAVSAGLVDPAEIAAKTSTLAAAAKTGREALVPVTERLSPAERVYQAASAGHPVSSFLQASGVKPLITRLTDPLTDSLRSAMKLSKGYNIAQREAQIAINDFNRQISPLWAKMDDAEKSQLYNEWTNPRDNSNPPPQHQAILDLGRSIQQQFAQEGIQAGSLFPVTIDGRQFIYPKSGELNLKLFRSIDQTIKAQDQLQAARVAVPPLPTFALKYSSLDEAISAINSELAPPSVTTPPLPAIATQYQSIDAGIADLKTKLKTRSTQKLPAVTRGVLQSQLQDLQNFKKVTEAVASQQKSFLNPVTRGILRSQLDLLVDYQNKINIVTDLTKASRDARYVMMNNFLDTAPAAFHPILEADIKNQAVQMVQGKFDSGSIGAEQLTTALKALDQGDYRRVFDPQSPILGQAAFAPFTYDKLVQNIQSGWWDMASKGLDPIFLHNVPSWQPFRANRAKIIAVNELTPGQFLPKDLLDMSPRYTNVGIGLSAGAAEFINMRGTEQFLLDHMLPRGLNYEEVLQIEQPQIDRLVSKGIPADQARAQVLSGYKVIKDPSDFGISSNKITARMGGQELYLPNDIYKTAQSLTNSRTPDNMFSKIATKGTSLFKASIFTLSPRHFVDEAFGNALLMTTKGGLDEWKNASKAYNIVTGGLPLSEALKAAVKGELPDGMNLVLSRGIDIMSADQIYQTAFGKKLGKFTHNLGAVQRVTEFINNIERTMSYLGEETRQLRKGASPDVALQAGLEHANKTFIDWDKMVPWERTVLRNWFPFYGFARYLLQFLYQYPADHPLRASILSHISSAEMKDHQSGLPRKFAQLFQLGVPDIAGNVKVSDTRALNPFRDGANMFTLAGFFSALGPFAQIPLQALGVNTLSGTPELYPELSIDPTTGNIVAKRTNLASRSGVISALGSFMPTVVGGLDHFIGLTDQVRRLKATDPTGYRRQLFSSLGIPFVPYNVNVPQEVTKQQRNLARVAQQRLSESTKQGGSTTELRRYNLVPWQGQLVNASALADLIDTLHQASAQSGIPTRMLMAELAKARS